MRTFTGVDIVFRLLNGTLSGAQLETALTTDAALYLGPWIEVLKAVELNALINSPTALAAMFASNTALSNLLDIAGAELAASDTATELISNTSSAILTVVTTPAYLDYWNNTPANKARMQARINASGSKLVRTAFTSSGTWTLPVGGVVGFSAFAQGGGGNGGASGNSAAAQSGGGGSGGESKAISITSGLPVANQTITIGTAGAVSTVGAILSAAAGVTGQTGTGAAVSGGGTDSGTIYDTDPANAIWQHTASKQGASGGAATGSTGDFDGNAGGNGLTGTGGAGGLNDGGSALGGAAGTGFGSGGGSGSGFWPGGAAVTAGAAASANTGSGGGGAGASASATASGGAGGTGYIVVYAVKA